MYRHQTRIGHCSPLMLTILPQSEAATVGGGATKGHAKEIVSWAHTTAVASHG